MIDIAEERERSENMEEKCTHNCSSCSSGCSEKSKMNLKAPLHELSRVKKVIGVVSGKGGVGKSLVTSLLAVEMARQGKRVAILDADITGPSIPKSFGIHERAMHNGKGIVPAVSSQGIQIMSLNLMLENETDPVIWRGSMIAEAVKQFWTDVIWDDVDVMFVDMPPGTGDVPLTVYQSLPIDGIVLVTSPQDLVTMIVEKAVKMAQKMQIPVLGIVENMSYLICPDCHKKISVFGESHLEEIAQQFQIKQLSRLPLQPQFATLCDQGKIEEIKTNELENLCTEIKNK